MDGKRLGNAGTFCHGAMVDWCVRQCVPQQCCRRGKFPVGSVPVATEVPNDDTARDFTINHSNDWHVGPCFPQQSCRRGKSRVGSVPEATQVPNDHCAREGTVCRFNCCSQPRLAMSKSVVAPSVGQTSCRICREFYCCPI